MKAKGELAALSLAHLLVDLCCAALLLGSLTASVSWWSVLLLYNGCAFALQMPLGAIADRLNKNLPFAAAGCLLVGVSFFLTGMPVLAACIAGVGNGAFHVGGGLEVLNQNREKAAPLGIFVSPGAIGLCLGGMMSGFLTARPYLPLLMLALVALGLLLFKQSKNFASRNALPSLSLPKGGFVPLLCLFLVVILRSFLGAAGAFSVSALSLPALVPVLFVAGGKAAGGFVLDKAGPRVLSFASLGAASLLVLWQNPWGLLLGVFLFNMTMPLTLFYAAKLLKGAKGFAFGLLTCGLYLGILPKLLSLPTPASPGFYFCLTALSLLLLLPGLRAKDL